jgi:hypothetical protein
VNRNQTVERRPLCALDHPEIICEPDTADYEENDHIGVIFADGTTLYLSHNGSISVWS